MKYLIVLSCCLVATAVAAKNVKISLEDIERDNLKSDKRPVAHPKTPSPSPTDFGFVPTRTASDYARQVPKQKYVQPQYIPAQHYTPPPARHPQTQHIQPPQQQYTTLPATQQYATIPQQYYYQQQPQQPNPYQQYENVQYVADNSIAQQPAQQYYASAPQYVYFQPQQYQQYTSPSTSVQTIVDPKGGIQYVMYIPTYSPRADQSQTVENVVYADPKTAQYEQQIPDTQYVTPSIKYAEPSAQKASIVASQNINREPKSLLDSYVPSVLQFQYYKQQQQAQANAIQQAALKLSTPVTGKVEYVKEYRTVPEAQNGGETVLNYNYQVPSAYHSQ